jgi:hypothetical protein
MKTILNFVKEIPDYQGYYANEYGEIFSKKYGEFYQLKLRLSITGYKIVHLRKTQCQVHRLVAMAWILNTDKTKNIINHKDGNKINNNVENLEWVTVKENNDHSRNVLNNKGYARSIIQATLDGKYIAKFPSIIEAERKTGIDSKSICKVCQNKRRHAGNYLWRYEKDFVEGKGMRNLIRCKKVGQYTSENVLVQIFETCKEAANFLDIHTGHFSNICKSGRLYKNHYWKILEKEIKKDETESWVMLEDYPYDKISQDGRIYSTWMKKEKTQASRGKYKFVSITDKNGKETKIGIHRLVALAYLPNPNNYPCVNHIDGNPSNNNVGNLEWCSYQQNSQHAHDTGLNKTKEIIQMDFNGNEINRFSSAVEASKKLNISKHGIRNCCSERSKTSGGFKWKYVNRDHKPKLGRMVIKMNLNKTILEDYQSIAEAAKKNDVTSTTISRWCDGTNNCKTHIWKYKN